MIEIKAPEYSGMDQQAHLAEAERFTGPGDCYIHIEMQGGRKCGIVIAGGGQAIVFGLAGAINDLANRTGTSFEAVIEAIRVMDENEKMRGGKNNGSR